MNGVDYLLLLLLLVAIIMGLRRGLFNGLISILGAGFGVIVGINYVDWSTTKVLSHMKVSPIMITMLSFVFFFILTYLIFKILGYLFYKIAELKPLGNVDRVGGAILGVFSGWIVLGSIIFLLLFLPLSPKFSNTLDNSFFVPVMRGTIPFIYEESSFFHPQSPKFIDKIKKGLLVNPGKAKDESQENQLKSEGTRAERIIEKMESYFVPGG
jgi:membrane protein required for colicin V production